MYKLPSGLMKPATQVACDEHAQDITMSKESNSLQREMSRLINQVDITTLFREKQAQSLCGWLCDFREYSDPDKFVLETKRNTGSYIRLPSEQIITIDDPGVDKIMVPPIIIGCNPVIKLRECRKPTTQWSLILDDAIQSVLNVADTQLLKLLYGSGMTATNLTDASTVVIHPSKCQELFGVDLWEDKCLKKRKCVSYLIPARGMVPTYVIDGRVCDENDVANQNETMIGAMQIEHDGLRVIMSTLMPNNLHIYCQDTVGVLCHTPRVYAIPCMDAKKLRAGFVISDEIGLCAHGGTFVPKVIAQ